MIVSNREKNKKVYLSDKELASMLGVSDVFTLTAVQLC